MLIRYARAPLLLLPLLLTLNIAPAQAQLSNADLEKIGRRIWQNECNGSVAGLTSWNSGEDFASLGIGHFIWYPAGQDGPFEESFPPLVQYLQQSGAAVPKWLQQTRDCPWNTKVEFETDRNSTRQKELRDLLSTTVAAQTNFIIARLDAAAPKMQAAAGQQGSQVASNIQTLRQSAAGQFAMIDYVNFKGDGLKTSESYKGQGWGLLQVLQEMKPATAATAPRSFADASKRVLSRRVQNSPPARGEKQWLPGWLNRCETYAK